MTDMSNDSNQVVEPRSCTRCLGTKVVTFILDESKTKPCSCCRGEGVFPNLDKTAIAAILEAIKASRGKNKGSLRASMTSPLLKDGIPAERAYYVWRLARRHGGKDTTMPVMADMVSRGDPWKKELDALAEQVARHVFGTDTAGAARWGRALGFC